MQYHLPQPHRMSQVGDEAIIRTVQTCHDGLLAKQVIGFSANSGLITFSSPGDSARGDNADQSDEQVDEGYETFNLAEDDIVAPGLLELQTNGLYGVHFTTLTRDNHDAQLRRVAKEMAKHGVTAWFATLPTVEERKWTEVCVAGLDPSRGCCESTGHNHTEYFHC